MLTQIDQKWLLSAARAALYGALRRCPPPPCENIPPALQEPGAAFVTLFKDGQLRGCIGYIVAMRSLYETVCEVAVKAGTQDPRFLPVAEPELTDLDISISVLSPLRKIEKIEEIEVGMHGIMLQTAYVRGLLLPQVAVEYGWNRERFLAETSRKAGLPPTAWKLPEVEIYIFTVEEFSEREFNPDTRR